MTGTFLGASLGLQSGVSPSRLSSDAARRSQWPCLAVDVLLDDRQRFACAGDGEVGQRPKGSAHAGANTGAGELTAHRVGGATLEPLRQCGDSHSWRVGEEQVPVVGLAVGLDRLGGELAAHRAHGLLAESAHLEHRTPVVGHEHQMGVQQRYAVAGASIGLGCQWSALRLWCARALPVPHRTDTDPAKDAGAGVRVLSDGVQRRAAGPRRRLPGRDKAVGQRDTATGDHCGQDHRRAGLAGRGSECGVGAVGQRLPSCVAELLRLMLRQAAGSAAGSAAHDIQEGSPAVVSATRNGFRVRPNGRLFVAKVGEVRVRWSRGLPAEPSSVTIIREPDGHYYASFVVDVESTPLPAVAREAGVDMGIARLATIADTDGARTDIANPKHLARKQRKLRRLEREKPRRQKGSANRDKTRRKVAIAHNEVARARRDFHHRQALALVRENQVLHVEDLNIVGMVANRWLAGLFAMRDEANSCSPRRESDYIERTVSAAHAGREGGLGLRSPSRRTPVADPHLEVPVVRCGPRPRPQRRRGHSRRRAGGESKRLPRKWAGPRKRFRWSTGKTSLREAW